MEPIFYYYYQPNGRPGFTTNQWLTFNQISKQGGQVKKGSKSHTVYFWKINDVESDSESKEESKKAIPIFKTYHVFNLEQTTLTPTCYPDSEFKVSTLEELIKTLNVTISHFGHNAYYHHAQDVIVLPSPDRFTYKENYYATLLHELIHWTAGNNCVPRKCFEEYDQNIKARAEEELVAEIGSVLLCSHYGLKAELENHASYIHTWKKYLNEKQVMNATLKAAKSFEWIIHQSSAS